MFQKLIFGGPFEKVPEWWYPQTMPKICLLNIFLYPNKNKKTGALAQAIQKTDFCGVH